MPDPIDRAAYDRISAAMYALDAHPGLVVLRAGGLRGETQRRGAEILARVDLLWSHYAALGAVLEQAKAGQVLQGPVIGLDVDGLALDATSTAPPATRITVTQLTQGLERGAGDVIARLDEIDAAGTKLTARFAPLTEALLAVRVAAGALGDEAPGHAEIDRLDADITGALRQAKADPLGATPDLTAALTARLERIAAAVREVAALRDGYPARAERLRSTVDELVAGQEAAAASFALANEKIANTALPELADAAPALRAHLEQLRQLYEEARWARLAEELAAAEQAAATAQTRISRLREAADGLLDRRTELRGRLDAYRARAGRLGLIEHSGLSTLHTAARDLLYTNPCDLAAATRAVVAYQRQLNLLTERDAR
jgi:hypothetical protein